MSSFRERNDLRRRSSHTPHEEREPRRDGPRAERHHKPRKGSGATGGGEWLWGTHAVEAAVANPARALLRLCATAERGKALGPRLAGRPDSEVRIETLDSGEIGRLLPPGAAHQGAALLAAPLESADLDVVAAEPQGLILMLDQVTDPQNVGAVLRSAAAFGARALVLQDRHAPPLAGATAKAAAGAVERTPVVRVVNLARALERLADLGWRAVGLASGDGETLESALDGGPTVLVLGSEGEGLRRLVSEHCDALARIDMPGGFESLNVSTAAGIALYAAARAGALRAAGEPG